MDFFKITADDIRAGLTFEAAYLVEILGFILGSSPGYTQKQQLRDLVDQGFIASGQIPELKNALAILGMTDAKAKLSAVGLFQQLGRIGEEMAYAVSSLIVDQLIEADTVPKDVVVGLRLLEGKQPNSEKAKSLLTLVEHDIVQPATAEVILRAVGWPAISQIEVVNEALRLWLGHEIEFEVQAQPEPQPVTVKPSKSIVPEGQEGWDQYHQRTMASKRAERAREKAKEETSGRQKRRLMYQALEGNQPNFSLADMRAAEAAVAELVAQINALTLQDIEVVKEEMARLGIKTLHGLFSSNNADARALARDLREYGLSTLATAIKETHQFDGLKDRMVELARRGSITLEAKRREAVNTARWAKIRKDLQKDPQTIFDPEIREAVRRMLREYRTPNQETLEIELIQKLNLLRDVLFGEKEAGDWQYYVAEEVMRNQPHEPHPKKLKNNRVHFAPVKRESAPGPIGGSLRPDPKRQPKKVREKRKKRKQIPLPGITKAEPAELKKSAKKQGRSATQASAV